MTISNISGSFHFEVYAYGYINSIFLLKYPEEEVEWLDDEYSIKEVTLRLLVHRHPQKYIVNTCEGFNRVINTESLDVEHVSDNMIDCESYIRLKEGNRIFNL